MSMVYMNVKTTLQRRGQDVLMERHRHLKNGANMQQITPKYLKKGGIYGRNAYSLNKCR